MPMRCSQAVVAEGDFALCVDPVVSDAVMGSGGVAGRGGFGPGLVGRGGGPPVQGSVGAGAAGIDRLRPLRVVDTTMPPSGSTPQATGESWDRPSLRDAT